MQNLVGTTLGNYQIVEQLGRGGMANVYKAYHPGLALYRALKVIRPEFASTPGFRERFQREAQAAASMRHPNVVQVHDFGEANGLYYMVMEFLEGEDLKGVLEKRGQIRPFSDIGKILDQVASALDFAHQRGIVHRDLKPGNVMITTNGQAVLTDFGIAKLLDSDIKMTETGTGIGTPAYMSPEQARGSSNVNATSDVYSLGIVLYEMLTGKLPFTADTPLAVMLQVVSDPITPPRQISPDIPDVLQGVILKATAKAAQERYQSAGALAEGFRQALLGKVQPAPENAATMIEARPNATQLAGKTPLESPANPAPALETPPSKAKKPAKRSSNLPLWLALGAMALCLCIVLPAGFLFLRNQSGDVVNIFQIFTGGQAGNGTTPGETGNGTPGASGSTGEAFSGKVNANQSTSHKFRAQAGQSVYFQLLDSSGNVYFHLIAPDERTELAVGYNSDFGPTLLPEDGEYTIIASDSSETVTYNFLLHFPEPAVIEMGNATFDAESTGELGTPGQIAHYKVPLQAGQTIYLDLLGDSALEFRLISPEAENLQTGYGSDFGPFTASTAGDYTLEVDGSAAKVGSYRFKLWNLPEAVKSGTLQLGAPVQGELTIPGQQAAYTVALTAGQSVYFDLGQQGTNLEYVLKNSNDEEVTHYYGGDASQAVPIPFDDNYTLVVDGSNDALGAYEFTVWDATSPATQPIVFNELTKANITSPGMELVYSIPLQVGESFYLEVRDTSSSLFYRLFSPDGYEELQTYYGSANVPFTAQNAGDYLLKVSTGGDKSASVGFIIWQSNPASKPAGSATSNSAFSGTLDAPGQVVVYTIALNGGETLYFTGVQLAETGKVALFAPDGAEVLTCYGSDTGEITIANAGEYKIVVDFDEAGVGSYNFTLAQR